MYHGIIPKEKTSITKTCASCCPNNRTTSDDEFIIEVETAEYNNDDHFKDDKEDMLEDLSFYHTTTRVITGCHLTAGELKRPGTSNMTEAKSNILISNDNIKQGFLFW
jgi:hypothetical protein